MLVQFGTGQLIIRIRGERTVMAQKPKVQAALKAMAELGINEKQVKPVLKRLFKLFDKNWELIEAENYRVLIDAIFDEEENEVVEEKKNCKNYDEEDMEEEPQVHHEASRTSKRLHSSGHESSSQKKKSTNADLESDMEEELPLPHQRERPLKRLRKSHEGQVSPFPNTCNPMLGDTSSVRPKVEKDELLGTRSPQQLRDITRSPESRAELQQPISPHIGNKNKGKQPVMSKPLAPHGVRFKELVVAEPGIILLPKQNVNTHQLLKPKDEPFTDDMAQDEVPIAAILPGPSSEENPVLQDGATVEQNDQEHVASHEKESTTNGIQASYNEGNTNSELATIEEESPSNLEVASSPLGEDGSISVAPNLDALRKTTAWDAGGGTKELLCMQSFSLNGSVSIEHPTVVTAPQVSRLPLSLNGFGECREACGRTASNGFSGLIRKCDLTTDDLRAYHDINDITKGAERVTIPWVNEMNSECPLSFFYISRSLVFRDADVNFCLSGIGDGDCCSTCLGDCLSVPARCACACQTGGEFAYTPEGLVKDDFLEECHSRRKFIKECWSKCGCVIQCGNRVVQRGINCKLQVFFTSEGKGWGLRTLEDLPKGAFVCEYVGEVLTSKELQERNIQSARSGKRPYPVLLDANWGLKAVLRNEEALCLDATKYGNVARFINHRCLDANLVEIPVEVETPDHCYYHIAFFTTRKVDALEELNWDYGIDFDDHDHPVKVFQCRCGSKFCRNMKRSNRSRSASIAA
ncbi:putative inactive histone-lysine N-methyltransferase SUVR2 isoform X2 [Prunus yedoensis var. nudiflora]|uniref:Putative inactive histone-lysine N-methyltransferase SUVR2 isoform X2 n=1 Tax=Prunus yedoensis var. nudiflora TaxID=2094558 RepID=A0A314ZL92_PRUYE|nr:putative inactive histone-lysine N-methyltransferase SUVR2 isoform X2 [Prunus yedoensis var. nudiflora]